ncbi:MAG TPA: nucleotidyltransferase family protein [Candidatus Nitrosotenuis sp.]|nr:nucleotidyltransferase family protein [Candidatus Nitrosotenuis sp.]
MTFPSRLEAVLLAGGRLEPLPAGEEVPPGKGLIPIGGVPMAARALGALKEATRVRRVVLVSPVPAQDLHGPAWQGVDDIASAGPSLLESFRAGLARVTEPDQPVLCVAGDLPFLTGRSVDDFIERCSLCPEASLWYGIMRRETAEHVHPGVRHTWARLREGTFCGTGFTMVRPRAMEAVVPLLREFTGGRKNVVKLAWLLGWGTVLRFLLGRLTIPQAEGAALRLLGFRCVAIESPFAETAFNVDSPDTLQEARRLASR